MHNYFITCPPRSGSTYLGELLGLNGFLYFNEQFTPQYQARKHLFANGYNMAGLDSRDGIAAACQIDVAILKQIYAGPPGSGFKMPYNREGAHILAWLGLRLDIRIVHIIRENLLEATASWAFLHHFGVSLRRPCGMYGTDGRKVTLPDDLRMHLDPDWMLDHFVLLEDHRRRTWDLFHGVHNYMEIHTSDVFKEGAQEVLYFLGCPHDSCHRPDHLPTPRPKARELFTNWDELKHAVQTRGRPGWAKWFD